MRILLILPLLMPVMAQADCPVAADLDAGVRVTGTDGSTETFSRTGDNIITAVYEYEASGSQTLLARGLYLLQSIDMNDGALVPDTRATYSYPLAPADMPRALPGAVWGVSVAVLDSAGLNTEPQVIRFGTPTRLTLGACGYDMIPVDIDYAGDAPYSEELHYIRELGFSLLAASKDGDEPVNRYGYVDIESVAP